MTKTREDSAVVETTATETIAADTPVHKTKLMMYFDPAQIEAIDRVWHGRGLKSRSETVRLLVDLGLSREGAQTV